MSSSSNTAKTVIPAFVIVLALIGFMLTSYWYYSQEIADVRKDLTNSKEELAKLLSAQSEKIALREVSLNALSEDVVKKGNKIEELEKSLAAAQDTIKKNSIILEDKLSAYRATLDTANKKCSELEQRIKELNQSDELSREAIQKQIRDLQRQIAGVAKQMLILREEVTAARADSSSSPSANSVVPIPVNTPSTP